MILQLKLERERRGWTQQYVASKMGITQAMLQKLETGQRKPSYPVLVKLEDLFHCNHRKLFSVASTTEKNS